MSLTINQTPPLADDAHEPALRWLIFTGVSVFAGVLVWRYGLIRVMVASDRTHISSIIALLYVAASAHCLWRCLAVSREASVALSLRGALTSALPGSLIAEHVRDLQTKAKAQGARPLDQTLLLRVLAQKLSSPNKLGLLAADTLLKLGLLGTIIGFILMLGPVAGLDGADEAATQTAMGVMSEGMAVAMYTTLAGLVGSILIKAQYALLDGATTKLFWDVVRLTETRFVPALERPDV